VLRAFRSTGGTMGLKTEDGTMIDATGTSFHGVTIRATVREMCRLLGTPTICTNYGTDKINFEWVRKTDAGDVFTVYDWKEYRVLSEGDVIEWHIGSHTAESSKRAKQEIEAAQAEKAVQS
jgi:hypothetical protein